MRLINKKRLINTYTIIAAISMPIVLFVSFGIQSSLFDLLFLDDFNDIPIAEVEMAKKMMINQILNWNNYHICSNMFTPLLYPIFATLPILPLSYEVGGYMQYVFVRKNKYKKTIISECYYYGLVSGVTMSLGYCIFIAIGGLMNLNKAEYDCGMLIDFFPDLMIDHPVLGGFAHSICVYLIWGFVFGLFGGSIAVTSNKSFLILIIPHVYYLFVGNALSSIYNITKIYFFQQMSPWYPVTITGLHFADWYSPYFSLIPIFILSNILIFRRCNNESKIFT